MASLSYPAIAARLVFSTAAEAMERNPEEGLGGNAARSSQGFKMTTPFQMRLLKVFSAADSQHQFLPNRALRPGRLREAQSSAEAFLCHSLAPLHSVALRSIDKSGEGEALAQVVHVIFDSRLCLLLLVSRLL